MTLQKLESSQTNFNYSVYVEMANIGAEMKMKCRITRLPRLLLVLGYGKGSFSVPYGKDSHNRRFASQSMST